MEERVLSFVLQDIVAKFIYAVGFSVTVAMTKQSLLGALTEPQNFA